MRTILNRAGEGKELRIVNDQVSSPTWCGAIINATQHMISSLVDLPAKQISEIMNKISGIYHLSCKGETSWYGFAKAILEYSNSNLPSAKLISIPTSEYPTPAKRPARSVLSNAKIARVLGIEMPLWDEALRQCLGKDSSH